MPTIIKFEIKPNAINKTALTTSNSSISIADPIDSAAIQKRQQNRAAKIQALLENLLYTCQNAATGKNATPEGDKKVARFFYENLFIILDRIYQYETNRTLHYINECRKKYYKGERTLIFKTGTEELDYYAFLAGLEKDLTHLEDDTNLCDLYDDAYDACKPFFKQFQANPNARILNNDRTEEKDFVYPNGRLRSASPSCGNPDTIAVTPKITPVEPTDSLPICSPSPIGLSPRPPRADTPESGIVPASDTGNLEEKLENLSMDNTTSSPEKSASTPGCWHI